MKFQQETDALEALEAVEAYLKERLTDARIKRSALAEELQKLDQSVKILEGRVQASQMLKTHWLTPLPAIDAVPSGTASGQDTLAVVVSIFESSTGKMRVKAVAEYAHKRGLITSSNGLAGVISMVNNTVIRNPNVFVNGGWGWWELAKRATIADAVPPSDSITMKIAVPQDNKADDDETPEQKPEAGTPIH